METKSILVVDDDFTMRRGIALMLRGRGYSTFEVENGDAALNVLEQRMIDLVILDLVLPGKDGIEVAKEMTRNNPDIKIILITAHNEHERAAEAKRIFQENFMEKKSVGEKLPAKVNALLRAT